MASRTAPDPAPGPATLPGTEATVVVGVPLLLVSTAVTFLVRRSRPAPGPSNVDALGACPERVYATA